MDVNVKVMLECSERLHGHLEKLLSLLGEVGEEPKEEAISEPLTKITEAPEEPKLTSLGEETSIKAEIAESAPAMEAPELESTEMEEPVGEISNVDLRKFMDETFARLEKGLEDKTKDSVHKQIIKEFRNAAKHLGYDRPTAIASNEDRAKFVKLLGGMTLMDNDVVVPF